MNRPKISIELDLLDKLFELIAFCLFCLLLFLPTYYFKDLPDIIPRHFNFSGKPDGFSGKNVIWTLPAISALLYIGLTILNRYPHLFNYPQPITEENAHRQYRLATKLIRSLKILITGSFCYITYGTIQTSLQLQNGLGELTTPIFLFLSLLLLGIYFYHAFRK